MIPSLSRSSLAVPSATAAITERSRRRRRRPSEPTRDSQQELQQELTDLQGQGGPQEGPLSPSYGYTKCASPDQELTRCIPSASIRRRRRIRVGFLPSLVLLALTLLLPTATHARIAQPRVVGGTDVTDPLAFPYFAQLADASCAAVLIHDDFLLTAAHCERRSHPFYKRVYFTSTELGEGVLRTIEYTRAHPAYLPTLQDYDFALLKLSSSALVEEDGRTPTGVEVLPINRNPHWPQPGDPLQAMGFGKVSEDSQGMNPTLQQVQIQYIPNDDCQRQYGADQFLGDVMFCGGVPGGGRDTCQGDSGGPIVDVTRGVLAGIVSYGIGCARERFAGVNARVSSVASWIDEVLCSASAFPPPHCPRVGNSLLSYNPVVSLRTNDTQAATETLGAMTLHITLDDYPREFAWSLTYLGQASNGVISTDPSISSYLMPTMQQLFVQLPETIEQQDAQLQESFVDLRPGQYDLEFGDNGNDGICCDFGNGKLELVNDITGETVWEHGGEYHTYLQVRIQIDTSGNSAGDIRVIYQSEHFSPSWEQLALPNYPPDFDPEWPGPVPSSPLFSFNVNFKFDAYPYESAYNVWYTPGLEDEFESTIRDLPVTGWSLVDTMEGIRHGVHNRLVPRQYIQQEAGWYWLQVTDIDRDGICCNYRRGWISIMAPIITTMDNGFVWGSDGEYGSGVDVYFFINDDGFVAQAFWVVADDAQDAAETRVTEKKHGGDSTNSNDVGSGKPPHRHYHSRQL